MSYGVAFCCLSDSLNKMPKIQYKLSPNFFVIFFSYLKKKTVIMDYKQNLKSLYKVKFLKCYKTLIKKNFNYKVIHELQNEINK